MIMHDLAHEIVWKSHEFVMSSTDVANKIIASRYQQGWKIFYEIRFCRICMILMLQEISYQKKKKSIEL